MLSFFQFYYKSRRLISLLDTLNHFSFPFFLTLIDATPPWSVIWAMVKWAVSEMGSK